MYLIRNAQTGELIDSVNHIGTAIAIASDYAHYNNCIVEIIGEGED